MSQIATVLCVFLILGLYVLARDSQARTSTALWIPVLWLLVGASRNLSEWLQLSAPTGGSGERYVEGNAADQAFLSGLLLVAVVVLLRRRQQIGTLLRSNAAIFLYFAYCGVSILWSDYPGTGARRWVKSVGDVVMVLVVLTDPDRLAALKRLFSRVGFLVVPLSVLFIYYYPELGRNYARSGQLTWTGVGTDKNALGMICLIFGLASVWHFVNPTDGAGRRKAGPHVAHAAFLVMVVWLLVKADSATSSACFFLAAGVMFLASRPTLARRPAVVLLVVGGVLTLVASAVFVSGTGLLGFVGREATLTGRTDLWSRALAMATNPMLGAGYESFWVGERLATVYRRWPQPTNQAHNGYIEVYLNLGWVGVVLVVAILLIGYRRLIAALVRQERFASLGLAYLVVACVYNVTEASFKMMHPLWVSLLLAITVIPEPSVRSALVDRRERLPTKTPRGFAGLTPGIAQPRNLRGPSFRHYP